MKNINVFIERLKNLGISIPEDKNIAKKVEKLIKIEKYEMGNPILLADQIPNDILILIDGTIRQLINNPLNGNVMTLGLQKAPYVLGNKSLKSDYPLEFVTAATDCELARLKVKDWDRLLNLYSEKELNSEIVFPDEILPIVQEDYKNLFTRNIKEIRSKLNKIAGFSRARDLTNKDNFKKLNLNDENKWFLATNFDFMPYGAHIEFSSFEILKEKAKSFRIIGIPKNILGISSVEEKTIVNPDLEIDKPKNEASYKKNEESYKKTNVSNKNIEDKSKQKKYPFYKSTDDIKQEAISCFRIIAEQLQLPIKLDLLKRAFSENVKEEHDRVSLRLCAAISESLGLKTQLLDLPSAMLRRVQTPCLIQLNENELSVVLEIKNDSVIIARPREGLKSYKVLDFIRNNSQQEYSVLILRTTNRTPKKRFGFSWFLPALKKNRKPLFEVLIASLFVNIFALMNPLILQQIIDKVIGQGAVQSLFPLGTLLISFSIFENVLTAIRTNLFIDTTNRLDISLGEQVIDHLLRLPLTYFDKRAVGELSSRVGELEQIRSFLTGTALTLVLDAIFSVIYIAVMLLYSWVLTIVALLLAPILAFITITISPIVRRQLRRKAELNAITQNHLVEVLTGVQTVKAQNFELNARWKWKDKYTKYISESYKNAVTTTTTNSITQFIFQASGLIVLCVGAYLVIQGQLTLGGLIAFRIISGKVTEPLLRLSNLYQSFQQTNISLERLSDIIDNTQESTEEDKNNIPMPTIEGSINFDEVSFSFTEKGKLNLSNVNFEIKRGEFVAIVGQSGSGKSTLTKLLARLYDPLSGKISIDNIDISKVELYSLRRQIGIVPQESILFDGTVQDNISLTNPETNTEDIILAAKIASAHDFIMDLPSGYASSVGERGSNLSGGQRQRIAIARSVLQNPQLLIMDESTSALDFETERKVSINLMDYFRGKTVLFITHRLNSIVNADKIVMLHDGHVEEIGTHNELMDLKGRYFSLYKQQESEI